MHPEKKKISKKILWYRNMIVVVIVIVRMILNKKVEFLYAHSISILLDWPPLLCIFGLSYQCRCSHGNRLAPWGSLVCVVSVDGQIPWTIPSKYTHLLPHTSDDLNLDHHLSISYETNHHVPNIAFLEIFQPNLEVPLCWWWGHIFRSHNEHQ